jgi:hypothetical protein
MAPARVLFLVFATLAGPARAGEISPALANQMAENSAGDPLTVLVFLHGGLDVKSIDLSLHEQKAGLATRHQIVVESLREAADAAQKDLVAEFETDLASGRILDFRSYWIINAVRVKADEATIRIIAARPDVDVVEPDLRVELIEPVARSGSDVISSIGITPGVVNIGARRVWDELGIRSQGALIGSLDTGVDGNHPALANRWRGLHAPWQECWLDVYGEPSQFPIDDNGHGTHCTGTMTGLALDDTIGSPRQQSGSPPTPSNKRSAPISMPTSSLASSGSPIPMATPRPWTTFWTSCKTPGALIPAWATHSATAAGGMSSTPARPPVRSSSSPRATRVISLSHFVHRRIAPRA